MPTKQALARGSVYIEADQALFREDAPSELSGQVFLQKDEQVLQADQVIYERNTEIAHAKKSVVFHSDNIVINSPEARFNLKDKSGTIANAQYQVKNNAENQAMQSGNGRSDKIVKGQDQTVLHQASYSTCPPQKQSWAIHSSKVKLDHKKNVGTAKNVTLKVGKQQLPVFYFPYFSFPLTDERKSGFLMPNYQTSDKVGIGLSLPYYFNLAPNYDLTLTPNIFTKRGILLGSEFRYLLEDHRGEVQFDILPNDDERSGEDRYYYSVKHYSRWLDRFDFAMNAEGVSDNDYFDDFGGTLAASSRTSLQRQAMLSTAGSDWNFLGRVEQHQLLDGSDNPYERLPQLLFSYYPASLNKNFNARLDTELVHFANKTNATDGTRFDVKAVLEKQFSSISHYIKPSVSLRHTQYSIDDNTLGDNQITRTLPTVSVDAGMYFDRYFSDGSKIQTLEPRLYYVRTPYDDQSDIPNFDSSEVTFNYSSLFLDNRFTGKDRVEDANRLSLSLTSRVKESDTGKEWLRASVGQIVHFDDRKVTLPSASVETDARSQVAFEAAGKLSNRLSVSSQALWNTKDGDFDASEIQLNYKDDKKRILNIGYRQLQDELEQSHVSFVSPVKDNWKLIGNWDHDVKNNRNLETMLGVEYGTCCVKTRVIARNYLTSDNNTYDNALFIEFAFKGMGSVGTNTKELLDERIYGYE